MGHLTILGRTSAIEKRKEELERLPQDKVKEEQQEKAKEEATRKAEEENRIYREQQVGEHEKGEIDSTRIEQSPQRATGG